MHIPIAETHIEDENAKLAYKVVGEEPCGERTVLHRCNSQEEALSVYCRMLKQHSTTIGYMSRTYCHIWWQTNK
jgi:hypothetical protein